MGGKTSVVKLTALIVIMAQIGQPKLFVYFQKANLLFAGSYVPAESVSLCVHDTVLTRMGVSASHLVTDLLLGLC